MSIDSISIDSSFFFFWSNLQQAMLLIRLDIKLSIIHYKRLLKIDMAIHTKIRTDFDKKWSVCAHFKLKMINKRSVSHLSRVVFLLLLFICLTHAQMNTSLMHKWTHISPNYTQKKKQISSKNLNEFWSWPWIWSHFMCKSVQLTNISIVY